MISIKYTEDRNYIRISNPISESHNIGYISPSDGELSVKSDLMNLIKNIGLDNLFDWKSGSGRHGGTSYESHTTNHLSVDCTINFIKRVLLLTKQDFEVYLD
jgi:hypothetical protein